MCPYDAGIATRSHFMRLSEEDSDRCKLEAGRLGIPLVELFRRMILVYFEVRDTLPANATPELTQRQAESLLGARVGKEQDKFNLTGEEDGE